MGAALAPRHPGSPIPDLPQSIRAVRLRPTPQEAYFEPVKHRIGGHRAKRLNQIRPRVNRVACESSAAS
jgi:hypothetical protein